MNELPLAASPFLEFGQIELSLVPLKQILRLYQISLCIECVPVYRSCGRQNIVIVRLRFNKKYFYNA